MSDGSDQGKKIDISAAVMASRGLKDQGIAETIDITRQSEEIFAVRESMARDKQWCQFAIGAMNQIEQAVRDTRVSEILAKMATAYKVGFETGRTYERENTEKEAKARIIV